MCVCVCVCVCVPGVGLCGVRCVVRCGVCVVWSVLNKYNFAKIKIRLSKSEKATKINIQKKINGK